MINSLASIQIDNLDLSFFTERNIQAYLQREDLIHPEISGNKYRKLKYNIDEALKQNASHIITFGGAYSNHIAATAAAGKLFNINTVGVIRGDVSEDNTTISLAKQNGMKIHSVSRAEYKLKDRSVLFDKIESKYPNALILPEGGSNQLAVKGCSEILNSSVDFDYVFLPVGTGGTLAGVICSLKEDQKAVGISVLKNNFDVVDDINKFLSTENVAYTKRNWEVNFEHHLGGYAKYNEKLHTFITSFYKETKIKLDPIYTGKMMYGAMEYISQNDLKSCKILFLHTGGLQGVTAFEKRFKKNLF